MNKVIFSCFAQLFPRFFSNPCSSYVYNYKLDCTMLYTTPTWWWYLQIWENSKIIWETIPLI